MCLIFSCKHTLQMASRFCKLCPVPGTFKNRKKNLTNSTSTWPYIIAFLNFNSDFDPFFQKQISYFCNSKNIVLCIHGTRSDLSLWSPTFLQFVVLLIWRENWYVWVLIFIWLISVIISINKLLNKLFE